MIAFFRRLWVFARPYRARLGLGLLFSILFACCNGLLVLVVQIVPDAVFASADLDLTKQLLARLPGRCVPPSNIYFQRSTCPSPARC